MIAAAILLGTAAVPAPAAAVPVPEPAIVVIGRKLKNWRGKWGAKKGVFSCTTVRSSGDRAIDAIGCEALDHCVRPRVPDFQAILDAKQPKAERDRRLKALSQSLLPCVTARHQAGIAALADRMAGS